MRDRELERRLRDLPVPGEEAAEERAWRVVRAAHAERTPMPARSPARKLVAAFAACAAVAAIALSPAGAEVVDAVRDVVGLDDAETKPALDSLPASGELLVESDAGPWIVRADGSKRLLGDYDEATWSPRGLFVAAAQGRQLVALEPTGAVRWTVTAPGEVRDPRWSPSGYRIAYRSGDDLRVVAGDGTGDHAVARDVAPVAPAWRPFPDLKIAPTAEGTEQVSYVDAGGRPQLIDADTSEAITGLDTASADPLGNGAIREIAWSPDGRSFVATRAPVRTSAIAPDGRQIAVLKTAGGQSEIRMKRPLGGKAGPTGGPIFAGRGTIEGLAWSPDGRWVLAGWRDADQWLFIRSDRPSRLVAIDDITEQFDPGDTSGGGFPRVEGWALPQR